MLILDSQINGQLNMLNSHLQKNLNKIIIFLKLKKKVAVARFQDMKRVGRVTPNTGFFLGLIGSDSGTRCNICMEYLCMNIL